MPSTQQQLSNQMLAVAAAACEDKKAEDIRILKLDPTESGLTDYFLICTGMSDRQNVAITDEIELRLKREFATYPNSVEGRRQGEWILMDYVDFIVHVFNPEKRAFYGLERLRKTATSLTISELNDELKSAITATRKAKLPAPTKASAKKASTKTAAAKKVPAKAAPAKAVKKVAAKKMDSTPATKKPASRSVKSVPAKVSKKSPAKKVPAKATKKA